MKVDIPLNKVTVAGSAWSQFMRSASPSNGDADACTLFSPTLGTNPSPNASQSFKMAPRRESRRTEDRNFIFETTSTLALLHTNRSLCGVGGTQHLSSEVCPAEATGRELHHIVVDGSVRSHKLTAHRHEESVEGVYRGLSCRFYKAQYTRYTYIHTFNSWDTYDFP